MQVVFVEQRKLKVVGEYFISYFYLFMVFSNIHFSAFFTKQYCFFYQTKLVTFLVVKDKSLLENLEKQ